MLYVILTKDLCGIGQFVSPFLRWCNSWLRTIAIKATARVPIRIPLVQSLIFKQQLQGDHVAVFKRFWRRSELAKWLPHCNSRLPRCTQKTKHLNTNPLAGQSAACRSVIGRICSPLIWTENPADRTDWPVTPFSAFSFSSHRNSRSSSPNR